MIKLRTKKVKSHEKKKILRVIIVRHDFVSFFWVAFSSFL